MNIGIFLNIGESIKDLKKTGQHRRLIDYYLKTYSRHFDKVYLFSYENESYKLPKNCILLPNINNLHRYFYAFLLPFIYKKQIKDCQVLRVMQLTGILPALISKRLYQKKIVATYGFDYLKFAELEGKFLLLPFLYLLKFIGLKFADHLITTTEQLRKETLKYNLNVFYIPNGVDVNKFRNQESGIRNRGKTITILFVGRLEKQKNLSVLIKAAGKLKDIKLLFVGRGSLKQELIKLSQKLSVPLEIMETVPYHQLVRIYQKADIFVLPSLIEGHPKVLLEAMSCGLACIGNKVSGIKDLLIDNKTGLLFDGTVSNLSLKMKKLIRQPADKNLVKKLGINAREFVKKHCDLNELLKKEISFLKELSSYYEKPTI